MLDNNYLFEWGDYYLEECKSLLEKSPSACVSMSHAAITVNIYTKVLHYGFAAQALETTVKTCEPFCARKGIKDGVQTEIGACFHPEELLVTRLWKMSTRAPSIHSSHVIMVYEPDELKQLPYYTCLRCAHQMLLSGIHGVYVYADGQWWFQTVAQAYETSLVHYPRR